MNRNHISSDRRFLTFPAIAPCSGVSPAALLADLSSLAADIDAAGFHQSEYFRTSRRAARDAIRYAAVLRAFLEDLRSGSRPSDLPPAAILGLSDLHVTLQKLRLLLADCARRGARVWILLNAERVADEFRFLLRSIASALEVLPLDSMDVSEEIRELVRLIASQARRVEVRMEVVDNLAARSVQSILAQLKSGDSPDLSDLRRVLSHLNIITWTDCFREVAFLEEQISSGKEDDHSALLWSLMGLMIYSMAVLIDSAPNGKRMKIEGFFLRRESTVEHLTSDGLLCPISLELMKDPVTVSSGQTYDRPSILWWLKSGKQTCPITGEKLAGGVLIPNFAVQKLVRVYCNQNGILTSELGKEHDIYISKTLSPATPEAVCAIRMAATIIVGKLASGGPEMKNTASYMIQLLSKSNIFNRISFVEAGAIQWLLRALSSSDHSLQENASAALLKLSKHHSGRTDIFESSGLAPVLQIMKTGEGAKLKQNAAAILFYLSTIEECRKAIGEVPEAIPAVVDLLKNGTFKARKIAAMTIYSLTLFSGNQSKLLAAEIVAAITGLLGTEEAEDLITECVIVLDIIAKRQDGTNAILKSCSLVGRLVHVMQSSSSRSGKECCASALLSLCKNGGEKALSMLEKIPLLMPTLYSLLSDGSERAKKKARSLLYSMHQFSEQNYSQNLPSAVPAANVPIRAP